MHDLIAILETAVHEVDADRCVALCVIVTTRGSTPQPAGTMVCVDEAACMSGTLGGGCVEADVRRQAHQMLSAGRSGIITFTLDSDFGYDDGMICGGNLDIAVSILSTPADAAPLRSAIGALRLGQPAALPIHVDTDDGPATYRLRLEADPKLIIAGAGHISRLLADMALPLGFKVSVIDDRADYANAQRFAPPIDTVVGDIAETLGRWPIDEQTYIVLVTRGHKHDEEALAAVLDAPAKYVGMIGSRRKINVIFDDLKQTGATETQLARVHAPIGVDIGAVTTQEIALSIAAELVAARRAEHARVIDGPFRSGGPGP